MHSQTLILDWVIYLAAALMGLLLFRRLGLGSVLGFLAAGIAIGPHATAVIRDPDSILHFSEFGVVLLLFVIGLELEPKRLWAMRRSLLMHGCWQWLATGLLLTAVGWVLGLSPAAALVVGLALALSSTAFALQVLNERNELATAHGRTAFTILLFQDVAVVPLLALVPLLAPSADAAPPVWPGLLLLLFLLAAGRYVLRPALRVVARSRSPEAFTGAALLLVFGVALAMAAGGLSMALGAFVAGILLADSEYRHELDAAIQPFKALLLGLFFVAVGASADLPLLAAQGPWVLMLVALLVLIKALVLLLLGRQAGLAATAVGVLAISLSQGGEFAFVILAETVSAGLLPQPTADLLILVVTLSMATTPLLLAAYDRWLAPRLRSTARRDFDAIDDEHPQVIIAGFGRYGQIIGRTLSSRKIPFTALDRDPEHVDFVSRFGNRIYFGDAARVDLLRAAGAERAEILVLAIDDAEASLRVAEIVIRHFPHLKLFARARNRLHAYQLMEIDCNHVMRETYVSSLETARAVLVAAGLTDSSATNTIRRFRQHDEEMMGKAYRHHRDFDKLIALAREGRAELQQLFEQDETGR
ncbi:MAG: monovalent cation:proton antiporter-2 (CPA2) family protein [Wenzhouxiangellaceae bacterium]